MISLPSASIVLCTYQGEKFLPAQLASLRAQTVQPREVIVQDDASTDSTMAILESEQSKHQGLPLQVKRNPVRLGFAQNFSLAMGRARGEVIFLCDQDDIWEPKKLELMLEKFAEDPTLGVVVCEGGYIDGAGNALPGKVVEGNGVGESEVREWSEGGAFPSLLRRNPVPGNLIAFRPSQLNGAMPVPEGWEHDYWVLLLNSGRGKKIAFVPEVLVRYRQHSGQTIGVSSGLESRWARAQKQSLADRGKEAARLVALEDRLRSGAAPHSAMLSVQEKRAHLIRRSEFSPWRLLRSFEIAAELAGGFYHRYEAGFSSALKDLLARKA